MKLKELGTQLKKLINPNNIQIDLKNESIVKVLIVDDEQDIIELVKRILNHKYGNSVEICSACNGFDAGLQIEQYKPDLMILDIRLPGVDGFEVCRTVKSRENLKNTKIIAISGNSMQIFIDKALQSGADDFLPKPFFQNQLIAKIEKLKLLGLAPKES